MKKRITLIFICVFLGIIFYSGYRIIRQLVEYKSGNDSYSMLERFVKARETGESPLNNAEKTLDEDVTQSSLETDKPETTAKAGDLSLFPKVNFGELKAINPDIVGWIVSENTNINYPVVQGKDNDFYLHHLFDGTRNSAGCIFVDCRNNTGFGDTHNILYGHHMSNGSMFSSLLRYKKQAYYDAHPQMLLMTPNANYQIDVFAGYVAKATDTAWQIDFESQNAYEEWLADALRRSTFKSGIILTGEEQIITLSTCSYEFYNARYVLLGILRWHPA